MWKIPPDSGTHNRTWVAWPWDSEIWDRIPGTNLQHAQNAIERLIRFIVRYENVSVLAPHGMQKDLQQLVQRTDQPFSIDVISAVYNDIWVRDTLPTFAVTDSQSLVGINWRFNGWGRRIRGYARYGGDAELSRKVTELSGAQVANSGITAEGGAFAFDGNGLIVATKSVVLDKNRNAGFDKDALEAALLRASGCTSICWLPGDRNESITTGHADSILSFGADNTALFHWVEDDTTPEYDVCDYNLRVFQEWADEQGRHYEIVRVSAPDHQYGDSQCVSYVNFAHVNGAIIMPKFGVKADNRARDKISAAFGGRLKVEMLDVRAITAAGGGIHCVTCHEPSNRAILGRELLNSLL
jgi:agmatine deiminase